MTRLEGFRTPAELREELRYFPRTVYMLEPSVPFVMIDHSQHDHAEFVDQDGNRLGYLCVPRMVTAVITNLA